MITKLPISKLISNFATIKDKFRLISTQKSNDLKINLHQYVHPQTQARIYHFQNNDPENAYASIVKTYVNNNKGCPHILQHLACCGSQKYPIRDPFFNMIKRSVNSYMNAWTGDDFTSYPFASANPKDWQNLYKVYLDMSLKPLLNQLDFKQQGWRYEKEQNKQKQIKGIVFNEMKGAYQDSDRQLMLAISKTLFKNTPYQFDTGGNPADIVNLQYKQLLKMYQYFYHPSNMSFYFYGNRPIQQSLSYLDKQYLNKYRNQSHLYNNFNLKPQIIKQRYQDITSYTSECNNISLNYFIGQSDHIQPLQLCSLKIISYILLEKTNALLYKKFIQSGIAQNIGTSGLGQGKLYSFSLTLKGIYPNYEHRQMQKQFKQVLEQLKNNGINELRLSQILHQFQIKLLTPSQNKGIQILQNTMHLMNHRLNFQFFLNQRKYLNQSIQKLRNKQFLSKIIDKYFTNNQNFVIIRQLMAEQQQKVTQIKSNINVDDAVVVNQQIKLKQRQNQKQDQNILPILKLQDLVPPKRLYPVKVQQINKNNKTFQHHHISIEQNINFYRLVFNFKSVDLSFLQKLSLWMSTINRTISTAKYTYDQLSTQLANSTSGFNVLTSCGGQDQVNVIFQFSCLKKNVNKAFELISQIIMTPKFQKQHTLNSFNGLANQLIQNVSENPMSQCIAQASSQLSRTGFITNSYQHLKNSLKIIKDKNIQDLYAMSLHMTKCASIKLIQHSNQISISPPKIIEYLLNSQKQVFQSFQLPSPILSKAITHNYNVSFCTQQYVAPKYLSQEHAKLSLLLELLQQDYLHPRIREAGGAYGSSARIRGSQNIVLTSYLDPNPLKTFQTFDQSIKEILSKDTIQQQKLLQTKLVQFGDVDRIKVPQNQGVNQIIKGYSNQQFQIFRNTLRNTKYCEVVQTGRKYLLETKKSRCMFGSKVLQGFEQQKLKDFLL